jgi:Secretion system C-terminal sorting domain/Concanavalin A-like lectin/glucanases superfamily
MKKTLLTALALGLITITNAQTWHKYSFNSGNANNDIGAVNNGTVTGATITTDRFGNANAAYDFGSGGTAKIDCGDISFLNNRRNITISGWFLKPATVASSEMFCKGTSASSILRTRTYNDGVGMYAYCGSHYTGAPINISYLPLPTSTWFHYALVLDSTNNILKAYINGLLFSQVNVGTYVTGTSSFLIGNANSAISLNEGWKGKLDDIYIVNRALSISQIDSLKNLPDPNLPPLEKFCYSFNTETPINDCGSTNNGTYIGPWAGLGNDHFGNVNKAYYCGASASGGVNCGDISLLTTNKDFSIAGWVQLITMGGNNNSNRYVFSKGGLALYNSTFTSNMVLTMGGQTLINGAATVSDFGVSGALPTSNSFAFFAVTRQGSTVKLYGSFGLLSSVTYTAAAPSATNTSFIIGNNSDMKADDILIINRALSSTQLDSLKNLPNPFLTTDINELDLSSNISIYPNPANDILNVEFSTSLEVTDKATITIINALGEEIINKTVTTQNLKFNTSNLTSGIYFVKVENTNGSAIKKIIKN